MKSNTAEGGSDGTLVTAANSGGTSGDAFTSRSTVANSVFKFSTAAALSGALGYEFLNSTGTSEANYVSWDDTALADYWFRFYLQVPALPTSTTELRQFRVSSAGAIGAHVTLPTAGTLQVRTSAEATVTGGTMTTVLSTNTRYRVEGRVVSTGVASVDVTLILYLGDSTTALETIGPVTASSSGTIASIGSTRIGAATATGNTNSIYMDDLVEFSTSAVGPISSGNQQSHPFINLLIGQ